VASRVGVHARRGRAGDTARCRSRRAQRRRRPSAVVRSLITIVIWSIAVMTVWRPSGNKPGAPHRRRRRSSGWRSGSERSRWCVTSYRHFMLRGPVGVGGRRRCRGRDRHRRRVSLRTPDPRIDASCWHIQNGTIRRVGNKSHNMVTRVVDVPGTLESDVGGHRRDTGVAANSGTTLTSRP